MGGEDPTMDIQHGRLVQMSINNEVFKGFKDVDQSEKQHSREINNFVKDDHHNVLNLTSMQGSGKTTAILDKFADSKDAIILTQSNEKIDEIIRIINERYPLLKFLSSYNALPLALLYHLLGM